MDVRFGFVVIINHRNVIIIKQTENIPPRYLIYLFLMRFKNNEMKTKYACDVSTLFGIHRGIWIKI